MDILEEYRNKLKKYFNEPWFQELGGIVNLYDPKGSTEVILSNIENYIKLSLSSRVDRDLVKGYEYFLQYLEDYQQERLPVFTMQSETGKPNTPVGELPFSNGYHIYGFFCIPESSAKYHVDNGLYLVGSHIATDRNIYIEKRSMRERTLPVPSELSEEVDYNSILAQYVFEFFNTPSAEYYLLRKPGYPCNAIFTKSFLKSNQELVHFRDFYENPNSPNDNLSYLGRMETMDGNIEMRYKALLGEEKLQQLINKLNLQYAKQEFIKLLIGPMDNNLGNTALVLSTGDDIKDLDINIAPAFDLDLSFNVADHMAKNNSMNVTNTSDGKKATIKSLIQDFKHVPGFSEYVSNVVEKTKNPNLSFELLDVANKKSGLDFFESHSQQYTDFLNTRFAGLQKSYEELYKEPEGVEI